MLWDLQVATGQLGNYSPLLVQQESSHRQYQVNESVFQQNFIFNT